MGLEVSGRREKTGASKGKDMAGEREKAWDQAILFLCSELLGADACGRVQKNPVSRIPMLPGEKPTPVKMLEFEKRLFTLSDQIGTELKNNPMDYTLREADRMIRVGHIFREILWASMAANHPDLPTAYGVRNDYTVVEVNEKGAGIFGKLFED